MSRAKRAKTIARQGQVISDDTQQVRMARLRRWKVASQSVPRLWYLVILGSAGFVCECQYYLNCGGLCKHVRAVDVLIGSMWSRRRDQNVIVIGMPQAACHHCKSTAFARNGHRRNTCGPMQRYRCQSCGRTFSGRPGFKKRHVGPEVISKVLREAAYGLSCTAVQAVIAQDGTTVHSSTIYRWIVHYSALMDGYSRQLRPRTSYKWHCDEIHFKIRTQARWLFAVMDGTSRFILSHDVSATKLNYNPAPLFAAARNLAGTAPWVLVADGLQAFCPAARRAFWSHNSFMLIHVREIHLRNRFSHNNKHERFNGEFRDRIKSPRIRDRKPRAGAADDRPPQLFPPPRRHWQNDACRGCGDHHIGNRQIDHPHQQCGSARSLGGSWRDGRAVNACHGNYWDCPSWRVDVHRRIMV